MISEQVPDARSGTHVAARLAWPLCALSVALVALSAALLVPNRSVADPMSPYFLNIAVVALGFSMVGALVIVRRPKNSIGRLLGAAGLLYATEVFAGEYGTYALLVRPGLLPGGVTAAWLASWLYVLGGLLVLYSFLIFPDGRLPSPRWRIVAWLAALCLCLSVLYALVPGPIEGFPEDLPQANNPFGVEGINGVLDVLDAVSTPLFWVTLPAPILALLLRFRRARDEERQQIKWVAYAAALLTVAIVAVNVWPPLNGTVVGRVLFLVGFVAVPVAIGIAILKHRLYDIDLVINRTLVYGALTACVVGIYVLIVGYLGALFRTEGDQSFSLIATGVVAVLFQPLRERLQRGVNRLMYGERDEPYAVVSRLGERLEGTLAPEAVLPTIVGTLREALKLPYAAIALPRDGTFEVTAVSGEPQGGPPTELLVVPLLYGGETIGRLLLTPRGPGEGFSAADRRLLESLARHAGVAVHGVRAMADLRHSRERLVLAREEERRRLRRDLHDDLAPTLAALGLTAATVGELTPTEPAKAASANEKLRAAIRATVGDVRRLVYDLRPPPSTSSGWSGR